MKSRSECCSYQQQSQGSKSLCIWKAKGCNILINVLICFLDCCMVNYVASQLAHLGTTGNKGKRWAHPHSQGVEDCHFVKAARVVVIRTRCTSLSVLWLMGFAVHFDINSPVAIFDVVRDMFTCSVLITTYPYQTMRCLPSNVWSIVNHNTIL